jgi:alkylation response protein AidB-like acyl-CoA dehydrogenase
LATDFQAGTNKILKHSRPVVCWIAVGICIGVYDSVIKYTRERKQFGKSIAGIFKTI